MGQVATSIKRLVKGRTEALTHLTAGKGLEGDDIEGDDEEVACLLLPKSNPRLLSDILAAAANRLDMVRWLVATLDLARLLVAICWA